MVRAFKNKAGVIAKLGNGTVRVQAKTLQSRFAGQIELTECTKTKIGDVPPEGNKSRSRIVLDFESLESIDVVIDKLIQLREELVELHER
jgi:prolyl-tRNA editing enzyme YbaK/EbsC (Cys-tRNA(Pro) deacylase)